MSRDYHFILIVHFNGDFARETRPTSTLRGR
jgi:hypothetical protein